MPHETRQTMSLPKKIRVLFLIPTLDVGGAEMDLVHNASRLDPSRFDVFVCCMLRRGALEEKLALASHCKIIGPLVPTTPGRTPWRLRLRWPCSFAPTITARLRSLIGRSKWPFRKNIGSAYRFLKRLACQVVAPLRIMPISFRFHDFLRVLRNRVRPAARQLHGFLPTHWLLFYKFSRPLKEIIVQEEIDVVHAILPNAYLVAGFACLLTKRPLVMSRASLNWYQRQQPAYWILERFLFHRIVQCATGNCRAIMDELEAEGIRREKCVLIYNGIPESEFHAAMGVPAQTRENLVIPPGAFVMTTVANLWPYKGHADLLQALAQADLPHDWIALFVGRDIDDYRADLEKLCAALGLTAHVRFLGQRDDVPALLAATDLYVVASHTEGLPNNVLEAMCAGLAVVATNVGGIPELVVDTETASLVPARQPAALAREISRLAQDVGLRQKMGDAARKRVSDHFSISRSVGILERIYTKVAGSHSV